MGLSDRHDQRGRSGTRSDDPTVVHDVRDDHDRARTDRERDDDVRTADRGHLADHGEPVAVPVRRSGAAVAALILGVIALLISVVPILGLVGSALGVIAIVVGIIGVSRSRKAAIKGAGMAVTGIVCGVLSLVLGATGLVLFGDAAADFEGPVTDVIEDVQTEVEELTN